jgi:hypothetical protein
MAPHGTSVLVLVLLHNSKPPITNRLYIGLVAQKVASLFI